jgi:hypothetical protein
MTNQSNLTNSNKSAIRLNLTPDAQFTQTVYRALATVFQTAPAVMKSKRLLTFFAQVKEADLLEIAMEDLRTRREVSGVVFAIFEFFRVYEAVKTNYLSVFEVNGEKLFGLEHYETLFFVISYYVSIPRVNVSSIDKRSVVDQCSKFFWTSLEASGNLAVRRKFFAVHAIEFRHLILRANELGIRLSRVTEMAVEYTHYCKIEERLIFLDEGM